MFNMTFVTTLHMSIEYNYSVDWRLNMCQSMFEGMSNEEFMSLSGSNTDNASEFIMENSDRVCPNCNHAVRLHVATVRGVFCLHVDVDTMLSTPEQNNEDFTCHCRGE